MFLPWNQFDVPTAVDILVLVGPLLLGRVVDLLPQE